jgi:hypothetical protein
LDSSFRQHSVVFVILASFSVTTSKKLTCHEANQVLPTLPLKAIY